MFTHLYDMLDFGVFLFKNHEKHSILEFSIWKMQLSMKMYQSCQKYISIDKDILCPRILSFSTIRLVIQPYTQAHSI